MYNQGQPMLIAAFHFIFVFAVVFLFFNTNHYECARISTLRGGMHSQFSRPELWLDRYETTNNKEEVPFSIDSTYSRFVDDFISKNESDYIISEDVISVILICEANYPVKMTFLHPEQLRYPGVNIRTMTERISEFNEDLEEPRTQGFVLYTSIRFHNVNFFSSTLVCQSVKNSAINSSVHVYKLSFNEIERQGETIQLYAEEKSPMQVELPCRPATPTASIILQKQTQMTVWRNEQFVNVPIWSDFKWSNFDPKIGFTLTLPKSQIYFDLLPPSISLFGLYKCSISGGDEYKFVFVNVTRKSVDKISNDLPFKTNFILRENAEAGLVPVDKNHHTIYDQRLYKCCSGVASKPPSLITLSCQTVLECETLKSRFSQMVKQEANIKWHSSTTLLSLHRRNLSSDCTLRSLRGGSVIISCSGQNVDITEQYFKLIPAKEQEQVVTKQNQRLTESSASAKQQHHYTPESVAWNSEPNRKIVISIGKPSKKDRLKNQNQNQKRKRIMRSMRFKNRRYNLFALQPSSSKRIYIQEVEDKTKDIYEGQSIYCMCFGLSMFHADGGYLRINWKNGTRLVLEDADYSYFVIESNSTSANSLMFKVLGPLGGNIKVGKLIKADREMVSVECFQPTWNSSRWERIQLNIEVHASLEPVFSGASDEIMYVNLNETGHEIVCKLTQGTPTPEAIIVTKDQKLIEKQSQARINRHSSQVKTTTPPITEITKYTSSKKGNIVTIKLPAISYESHGVYECTAENSKGRAVKTVRLIVVGVEKSSAFPTIFLICIAILSAILLGLGVWIWIQRRNNSLLK
ncbi:unnamed protein product [Orchesella dallaii]|uniref:Ig-like domain-containing protein n=1 Tax=Orchesella dallaii TaxID=48710 RepID=A0ABP1PMF3_9HEXA